MIMIVCGCLSVVYMKVFVVVFEDWEMVMKKFVEVSGSKLLNFYFIVGDKDFIMIFEIDVLEKVIVILLVVILIGMVIDMNMLCVWICVEFKVIGERVGEVFFVYCLLG